MRAVLLEDGSSGVEQQLDDAAVARATRGEHRLGRDLDVVGGASLEKHEQLLRVPYLRRRAVRVGGA